MNKTERKMRDILIRGREEFGVVSVKAEFEAEGTRMDEMLRLVDIARSAGLPLTVKIGGCEAIRDLLESKQIGVSYVVAPMIETPYALSKFVAAKNLTHTDDDQEDTDFLFNLETITGFENLNGLGKLASQAGGVDGIVFGRVDFAGSLGLTRDDINGAAVTKYVVEAAHQAKAEGLDFVMGGAISSDTLEVVREVAQVHLTRFETRKVVFAGDSTTINNIEQGLVNAVHFEMLWLQNKRDYYSRITAEDENRIRMLESRWKLLGS